jgi:hypothetical protein
LNYVFAGIVGMINLILVFRSAKYVMWPSWLGLGTAAMVTVSIAATGFAIGLACSFVATRAGWQAASIGVAQGVGSALIGVTLMRADFGRPLRKSGNPANAIRPFAVWLERGIDELCRSRISDWALNLSPTELTTAAELAPARDTTRRQRKDSITDATKRLIGTDAIASAAAKGELARFIAKAYVLEDKRRPHIPPSG